MFPLKNPNPDIDLFLDVVKGKKVSNKVLFGELKVDDELQQVIFEDVFKGKWVPRQKENLEKRATYWNNVIEIYYRLGYDFVRVGRAITFPQNKRVTKDTSDINVGNRSWAEEDVGLITDRESFERYEWPKVEDVDLWDFKYVSEHLPSGMGMVIGPSKGILEAVTEILLGFTGLSYMIYDDEALVDEIFKKVGDLLFSVYERILKETKCVGFFQGDDMGYKTGLMFSKKFLKKYVLPWHKRLTDLAHENGLIYILHSCGNLRSIGQDIIDIGVDVKHSFEDSAWSVLDYKTEYGNKIAIMGGVDIDKLTRSSKDDLRVYCEMILDNCMEGGRYIYGSGNSVTNYVPIENYLAMLEVGLNWRKKERLK